MLGWLDTVHTAIIWNDEMVFIVRNCHFVMLGALFAAWLVYRKWR